MGCNIFCYKIPHEHFCQRIGWTIKKKSHMLDDARMQKLEFMPFMGKSLKKQKKCPILHPYIDIASGVRLMFVCDLTPECCATILSEFYIIDR